MELGPIELVVFKFPGNKFKGEIIPELKHLVESGTIRIVDIIFVRKDTDGSLTVYEMDDLEPDVFGAFDPVVADITGLLSREDAETFGAALEANSSAAVMLFEDTWATRLVEAIRNADGEVVLAERVPRAVIDDLLAAAPAA